MKTATEVPPAFQPHVDKYLDALEQELRQVLGARSQFVLVIAMDGATCLDIQAVTNTTPQRAHALLRAADAAGFDRVN